MSIETVRELETLASVCPELNMANYTEDDVRHLNDWAIEMSLLVERYALSQQPDNAACKSAQKRLEAQQATTASACGIPGMVKTTCPYCEQGFAFEHEQPATGEPFGYIHHFVAHDDSGAIIDTTWEADGCADALPHPTHPAAWKWSHATPFYTTPQPSQAAQAESEPVGARKALERIASWSEHPAMLGVDYGSNGVRDYYRKIARDALTHPAPGVPDDSKRLDYLQDRGATIDLIPGVAGFYPMRFRVGGLHSSANIDVRAAIDAAMLTAAQTQKGQP